MDHLFADKSNNYGSPSVGRSIIEEEEEEEEEKKRKMTPLNFLSMRDE